VLSGLVRLLPLLFCAWLVVNNAVVFSVHALVLLVALRGHPVLQNLRWLVLV
jgi:hypothetical protein